MSKKRWEQNDKGAWYLYFDLYSAKETVLRMVEDPDEKGLWCYVSDLLRVEVDDFEANDLEEAKEIAEDKVLDYYKDKVSYYEEMIKRFEEE